MSIYFGHPPAHSLQKKVMTAQKIHFKNIWQLHLQIFCLPLTCKTAFQLKVNQSLSVSNEKHNLNATTLK